MHWPFCKYAGEAEPSEFLRGCGVVNVGCGIPWVNTSCTHAEHTCGACLTVRRPFVSHLTSLVTGCLLVHEEHGVDAVGSGNGISEYDAMPWWATEDRVLC
jgi:hypothetical protein